MSVAPLTRPHDDHIARGKDWTKPLDIFRNVWKGLKAAWKRSTSMDQRFSEMLKDSSMDSSLINTEQGNKDESAPNDERQNMTKLLPLNETSLKNNAMKDRLVHRSKQFPDRPGRLR